jgi:hypothetical protein
MITKENFFLACLLFSVSASTWDAFASFEKDPLKETQSETVPVTEELLTREGEPGPASPTYPMADTSRFLVKTPYENVDKYEGYEEEEDTEHFWNRWFFWKKKPSGKASEPLENK